MAVVVDVNIQTIHHIEMRIGKQLFHGGVLDIGRHLALHERAEIGILTELVHIFQGGCGRGGSGHGDLAFAGRVRWRGGRFLCRLGRQGFALPCIVFSTGPPAQETAVRFVSHCAGLRDLCPLFCRCSPMPGCQSDPAKA